MAKNLIKALVDEHNMTIEQIAARVGCAASTVWTWYRGTTPRTRYYVRRLIKLWETVNAKKSD